jgi:hypothetical protein
MLLRAVCIFFLSHVSSILLQFFSVYNPHGTNLLLICWDNRSSLQPPFGMLCIRHHQDSLHHKYLSYQEKNWKCWLQQHHPFHHFFLHNYFYSYIEGWPSVVHKKNLPIISIPKISSLSKDITDIMTFRDTLCPHICQLLPKQLRVTDHPSHSLLQLLSLLISRKISQISHSWTSDLITDTKPCWRLGNIQNYQQHFICACLWQVTFNHSLNGCYCHTTCPWEYLMSLYFQYNYIYNI